jgi:hypothetical protein
MMLLNAIGAGILCHSDVEYFGMLSDANSKNMFEWTKEDRASFFNDTCKDENYKLLLVSGYICTYIPLYMLSYPYIPIYMLCNLIYP